MEIEIFRYLSTWCFYHSSRNIEQKCRHAEVFLAKFQVNHPATADVRAEFYGGDFLAPIFEFFSLNWV